MANEKLYEHNAYKALSVCIRALEEIASWSETPGPEDPLQYDGRLDCPENALTARKVLVEIGHRSADGKLVATSTFKESK